MRIVIPMSKASLATFSLFYAVGHWNNYLRPMIFLDKSDQWPIVVWLRQIVILSLGGMGNDNLSEQDVVWAATDAVKYATIVVSTVPIICVYPFLQKHFAKGVLLGSVKG
jgi:putative aldouronate transport system permease protein